ncbi:hypothetical protein Pla22_42910 [Rubripirellula amarantea]|uniref:Protein BatD n=1 Tax=Rubripirellula amarantea TaxID=2527999 RepID=A0A5C5WG67_9BACT|nr:hypothetical protein [Rubripirellula amarantea]TWT49099.1 hypothetical protein Pla22_42910 [Rubripirellula amarantea]
MNTHLYPHRCLVIVLLMWVLPGTTSADIAAAQPTTSAPMQTVTESSELAEVTISLERGEIQILEPFDVVVRTVTRSGTFVTIDEAFDDEVSFPNLEILDRSVFRSGSETSPETEFRFQVQAFRTGQHTIGNIPFNVESIANQNATDSLMSPSLDFSVKSILPEGHQPSELRDLKPAASTSIEETSTWWLPAAIFLALVLAAAFWRRRKRLSTARQATRLISEIDALESSVQSGNTDYATAIDQLSRWMINWISQVCGIEAASKVSNELLPLLRQRGWDDSAMLALRDVLDQDTAYKYGGLKPESSTNRGQTFNHARHVVRYSISKSQRSDVVSDQVATSQREVHAK